VTPGRILLGALALALIVSVGVAAWRFDLAALADPEAVTGILEAAGAFAPLVLIVLMAAAIVISPIPSIPLDIAAGAVFGPVLGTLYAVIGGLIGALIAFWIARLLGRRVVARLVGGHVVFCAACSDRMLPWMIMVSRLIPAVSFDLVSYGAGLTAISTTRFALATAAGMLPLTALYTSMGAVLSFDPWLTVPLGALAVMAMLVLPRWIARRNPLGLARVFPHDPTA